jgi:hypothetical protein
VHIRYQDQENNIFDTNRAQNPTTWFVIHVCMNSNELCIFPISTMSMHSFKLHHHLRFFWKTRTPGGERQDTGAVKIHIAVFRL